MTTFAEHIIVAGAKNHPPMLEKSMYDSWSSRIRIFIKGKKHGRVMLDSIDNGLLVYPTVKENGQTRPKKYSKLTEARQLQDDCDVQATNIILHGLPPDVYALVNHQEAAKDIWVTPQSQVEFPQLDSGLAVPMFQQGEDPIECINKAMEFLSAVVSRFPPSNNQLRTSFNPRNQATIQGIATTSKENVVAGLPRVVKYYNCLGEGHMARQCTQPKRLRNVAWFKDKLMLVEAQEAAFQTYDLDAYNSDCNDLSSSKAVLMANLSSYDIEVLSEYLQESQDAVIQDTNPSAPNDLLMLSLVEQMTDYVAHLDKKNQTNKMVFAITTLKNELRKLKGKNVVNTVVSKPNATLALGMFKLDIEPISSRLKNNRDAHEVYIEKTIEHTDTLRRFVERARTQYPSETLLESA
nr:hypothetical protein [Tanacetum cinerariifolium]